MAARQLARCGCHHPVVFLWATYSDLHTEVSVSGDREGLHGLAVALSHPKVKKIVLDEPPIALDEPPYEITESHAIGSISVEPDDRGDPRIRFTREGTTL